MRLLCLSVCFIFIFIFQGNAQESENPIQREIIPLLKSKSWPHQAFALMRMEKYKDDKLVPRIIKLILTSNKYDWHTKVFALRAAGRMKIPVDQEITSKFRDPLLMRAAIFAGIEVKAQLIENMVLSNMRSSDMDKVVATIEMAAASYSEKSREMAQTKLHSLFKSMDDFKSLMYGSRLCRLVGEPLSERMDFDALRQRKAPVLTRDAYRKALKLDVENKFLTFDEEKFNQFTSYYEGLQDQDLDVVAAIDGTGSMGSVLRRTQAQTHRLMKIFDDVAKSMQFGIIIYRDKADGRVESKKLTKDVKSATKFLSKIVARGGGDHPEWVLSGVKKAGSIGWRSNSDKHLIIIGDAPPHAENLEDLQKEIEGLRSYKKVSTHAIVSGFSDMDEFKNIAKWGKGQYGMVGAADDIAKVILKFSMDPLAHELFDDFYEAYILYCL